MFSNSQDVLWDLLSELDFVQCSGSQLWLYRRTAWGDLKVPLFRVLPNQLLKHLGVDQGIGTLNTLQVIPMHSEG